MFAGGCGNTQLVGGLCTMLCGDEAAVDHHVQVNPKPRSELEALLQKVAPNKEVMIGISNYNLIPAGELVSFLDVSVQPFTVCR